MPDPAVSDPAAWLAAAPLLTPRLRLEPLRVEHAQEAVPVFADIRLHTWTGGEPRSFAQLKAQYRRQSVGRSPDGTQGWLNWMLRRVSDGQLVGTVQATLTRPITGGIEAALAWVVGVDHQRNGYAREGALTMAHWLREQGVDQLVAHIHPGNDASVAVARTLGLNPSDTMLDGEVRWIDSGGPGEGSTTGMATRTVRAGTGIR
ncbi:GNAT family N-acetyltransferase [Micromonospora polyrhachis]|uniref:RimJ/RimL family protein N-acetyltransferase n=1 Tax=Micromonospora polyrhachis TaxID=1282883 RepID=A0A7W7WSH1_9ACTN|nr:GNAT family N-acetyltransferase [Micromonospora polyrhachis]MBB4961637.1 RimJ/RimL family protein N-acetyltransferase [Micromonospora polyrhachis]